MSDTTFVSGTVVTADWLNDANDHVYNNVTTAHTSAKITNTQTSGTSRTVQSKLSEVLSVADFNNDIETANDAAIAAGKPLYFPAGTYNYTPTAVMDIEDWVGDGPNASVIVVNCAAYSGVVFRMADSTKIEGLRIYEDGLSKVATGLQLSAADSAEFTGHQRLVRVTIQGFNKNLDVNNVFMITADQCRFESGAEGLYCAPIDQTGDNGYVTTHTWNNCWFYGNTRNVYYAPALNSFGVSFIGGSIEAATGAAEQAYFTKMRVLTFAPIYLEGASTIPALRLVDVAMTTIDGAYVNGTGGITLGTNAEVSFRNVLTTASTDVLTGGDGTQRVNMEGCQWPSSGNSAPTLFSQFSAVSTSYNGLTYAALFNNLSTGIYNETYTASITPNLRFGNIQYITVTDTNVFTINAPTNGTPGARLALTIRNTSGGVHGNITWNAVYKLAAWTKPATGFNRSITFYYDGTNWIEDTRSSNDVPN